MADLEDHRRTALQMMSMPGRLLFGKQGVWQHDGIAVSHPRIAEYFSKHLRFSEEHNCWVIAVDGRCVAVEIEDTPFVVVRFKTAQSLPWQLELNSGHVEEFDPSTVVVGADQVFYCRCLPDRCLVRILRNAASDLWPFVTERQGRYYLEFSDKAYLIEYR